MAAWITWVLSSLAVLFFVMIGLVMVAARDDFLRQLERDPNFRAFDLPTDQVVAALWVMGAIALFWGVSAIVLAWFAYRRANWARVTLVVSSAVTLLISLAAFPVGLLHTLGAGAVIALLFLGGANQWFARDSSDGQGFPGAFQPYGPQQGQQSQQGQQGHQSATYPSGQTSGDRPQSGAQGTPYDDRGANPGQGSPGSSDQGTPDQSPASYTRPEEPRDAGSDTRDKKDEPPSNVW